MSDDSRDRRRNKSTQRCDRDGSGRRIIQSVISRQRRSQFIQRKKLHMSLERQTENETSPAAKSGMLM